MKTTLDQALPLFVAVILLLSGCSTASTAHTRGLAAADEPLIEKFVDALANRSAVGSQEAVEDALTQLVNDNASKLSISKIDSLDEIAAMSDADQRRIIGELASLPELSQKLALDSDAVEVARSEAIAAQDVKSVSTEEVADLQGTDSESRPGFARLLERAPQMRDDVSLILRENSEIRRKTGVSVLGKGCNKLANPDSVENIASMITGVDNDVVAGQASDTQSVAKSLHNNMEYVLGTDDQETHARICALSDSNRCAVFSPRMCN